MENQGKLAIKMKKFKNQNIQIKLDPFAIICYEKMLHTTANNIEFGSGIFGFPILDGEDLSQFVGIAFNTYDFDQEKYMARHTKKKVFFQLVVKRNCHCSQHFVRILFYYIFIVYILRLITFR